MERAAIFIDHENVRIRLEQLQPPQDVFASDFILKLKKHLNEQGICNPSVYVYDNFEDKYFSNKKLLSQYTAIGVIPTYSLNVKDAVDIQLSLDAYEMCLKEECETFVIVSSDKDMFPLVSRLKHKNKKVVLVGVTFNTSNHVIRQVDKFIPIEEVMGIHYEAEYLVKKDIIVAVKRLNNLYNWVQGKGNDLGKNFFLEKLREELYSSKEYATEIFEKLMNNGLVSEYDYEYKGVAQKGLKFIECTESTNILNEVCPSFH
ncbi:MULTISPECIES: NYN domain-containing protein [Bacillus cereus group]|uniref:NYN domain-containing protein n=1 Tax=Bacillus cereus group TaxID=86661 RepID=UPI00032E8556|nr:MULTISPECIES: NYN domain-containing protein [Bacillus cereus group]EOP24247.1 hypothetical protein IG5_03714 [Bacillus toyonensis]